MTASTDETARTASGRRVRRLVAELAARCLSPLDHRVCADVVQRIGQQAAALESPQLPALPTLVALALQGELEIALRLTTLLVNTLQSIDDLRAAYDRLREELGDAAKPSRRKRLMLEFLARITPARRRWGDARAFSRYMELDAVKERFERWQHEALRKCGFIASMITGVAAAAVKESRSAALGVFLLQQLGMGEPLRRLLFDFPRWQSGLAVVQGITAMVEPLPPDQRRQLIDSEFQTFLQRCSQDAFATVWLQLAACRLLLLLDAATGFEIIRERFSRALSELPPHDIFARSGLIELLVEYVPADQALSLINTALRRPEPSEHVQIELVKALRHFCAPAAWKLLTVVLDPKIGYSHRVRLQATLTLGPFLSQMLTSGQELAPRHEIIALAVKALGDPNLLVVRGALELAVTLADLVVTREPGIEVSETEGDLLECMDSLLRSHDNHIVRRFAAAAKERLLVPRLQGFAAFKAQVIPQIATLDEGKRVRVKNAALPQDRVVLGRMMAYFSQEDFGLSLKARRRSSVIQRGDRFARQLWRILHEMISLGPDKRQSIAHSGGRLRFGSLRAPSRILAEAIQTKVVGEPLVSVDGTWKPFLPLTDDYYHFPWRHGRTITIVSSEGITTLGFAAGSLKRLRAELALLVNYGKYALMRVEQPGTENATAFENGHPFVKAMTRLGFVTTFTPHAYRRRGQPVAACDPEILRCFAQAAAPQPQQELSHE